MKKDITSREDIVQLVDRFYERAKSDDLIGPVFTEIVKVNWEKHLPVMYTFWENILFYTGGYEGNPLEIHRHLNRAVPLTAAHFFRWNELFATTVQEMFSGEKAALAIQRAMSISTVMQLKLQEQ